MYLKQPNDVTRAALPSLPIQHTHIERNNGTNLILLMSNNSYHITVIMLITPYDNNDCSRNAHNTIMTVVTCNLIIC